MAVILAIAFLNWSAFISWSFWAQVCAVGIRLSAATDRVTIIVILPELSATRTRENHGPVHSHVHRQDFVQFLLACQATVYNGPNENSCQ